MLQYADTTMATRAIKAPIAMRVLVDSIPKKKC